MPTGLGKHPPFAQFRVFLRHGGEVRLDGRQLGAVAPDRIVALGIAHVPEGRGIFGNLTVMENLRLGAWIRGDRKEIARDLDRVLNALPRLRERREQPAGTLSGGEQQMLAVGRALMSSTRMLLLDEPSMGLAPKLVKEIYNVIREINRTGVTILLVEQNANLALRLANRAAVLENGMITLAGSGAELLQNARVREAYLGCVAVNFRPTRRSRIPLNHAPSTRHGQGALQYLCVSFGRLDRCAVKGRWRQEEAAWLEFRSGKRGSPGTTLKMANFPSEVAGIGEAERDFLHLEIRALSDHALFDVINLGFKIIEIDRRPSIPRYGVSEAPHRGRCDSSRRRDRWYRCSAEPRR